MNDAKNWVVGRTLEQAMERAEILAGDAAFTLEQDGDLLDTFFSTALWPFSIMGWPDNVRSTFSFTYLHVYKTSYRLPTCKISTPHPFSKLAVILSSIG